MRSEADSLSQLSELGEHCSKFKRLDTRGLSKLALLVHMTIALHTMPALIDDESPS
jgi:hypothetical protein